MRLLHNPRSRSRLLALGLIPAVALAACSASGSPGTHPTGTHATGQHAATPPAAAPTTSHPAQAASASGLSGTWNGRYGGSYQGTFVISWHQSGTKLGGHIRISDPASILAIHGTVSDGTIRFGTVGSYAITYSGTVSGTSMSGTYKVGAGQGGNWSASKG